MAQLHMQAMTLEPGLQQDPSTCNLPHVLVHTPPQVLSWCVPAACEGTGRVMHVAVSCMSCMTFLSHELGLPTRRLRGQPLQLRLTHLREHPPNTDVPDRFSPTG